MVNNNKFLLSLGYSIIVLATLIQLISTIFYISGLPISAFNFWIPLLATIIFIRFMSMYNKESTKMYLWNIGILLTILVFGGIFSALFFDLSYDGQAYQLEAIIQLSNGWNPFRGIEVEGYIHDIWINHFAKGPWIIAAAVHQVTGMLETAKVFNIALLFSSFFVALGAITTIFPNDRWKSIIISVLLALNPVVITQITNFNTDGQVYSLLLIAFCLFFLLIRNFSIWELVMLCLTILLLINTKFVALTYILIATIGFIVVLLVLKKITTFKLVILPLVVTFIVGFAVVGYNPYITNMIEEGTPFFPLSGENEIEYGEINSPSNFINSNPIKNLAKSLLSKSSNQLSPSELKLPFTVERSEIEAFLSPDVRVGGFGPLFGGCILFAIGVLLVAFILERSVLKYSLSLGAFLLSTMLVTSEIWWARNSPQVWIFPVIVLISCSLINKRLTNMLSWILAILLFVNMLVVSSYHLKEQYWYSRQYEQQLEDLASKENTIQVKLNNHLSTRNRLQEFEIEHELVNVLGCNNPKTFPLSEVQYCE